MTPQELAAILTGTEYPVRLDPLTLVEVRRNGLVIVYGASDDLMEFAGSIYDEFGCYEGGIAKVDAKGLLRSWESVREEGERDEIAEWLERDKKAKEIKAVWSPAEPPGASWAYETTIPHATFDVMDDGEIYCRGIVFSISDL